MPTSRSIRCTRTRPTCPCASRTAIPARCTLQTGLTGAADEAAPSHLATLTAAQTTYTLAAGATELRVPLSWTDGHGLTVTKTFVFKRGLYRIDLVYDVHNESPTPRALASYAQILRHWEHASRSYFDVETYSFKGPAVFDGTKSHDLKVESEPDSKFSETITNGWLASLQHHFVSAIVPPGGQPYHYRLQVEDHRVLVERHRPVHARSPPGATATFSERLFIGPKLQSQLAATGPRLDLTADYGLLTVIAHPLFMALNWVHGVTGNWGWAIIIVTALIKLIFYPLSQASGRSMAKMRAVAPRMKQIQETFKDDREKLGRAMMELYKREKINPLAGCLPMVVQIPVFISFYWVLVESVEMRQAPFLMWINDLSAHDRVLRAAAAHGRRDVRAVQAESRAAGSDAGEDHAVHAAGDDGHDGVVPVRPGALLAHQHGAVDRAAVAHQPGDPGQPERTRAAASSRGLLETGRAVSARYHSRHRERSAGRGAVGVVRVSGPRRAAHRARDARLTARRRGARSSRAFSTRAARASMQGIALYFPAPASLHGRARPRAAGPRRHAGDGSAAAPAARARRRMARPGEFSERAYFNGKMDVAQAEAVADLDRCRHGAAARAAVRSMQGEFSARIAALGALITDLRVHVEAAIDFPDEEIDFLAAPAFSVAARARVSGASIRSRRRRAKARCCVRASPS